MVKMEVLKFDENGQGYIDFDALAAFTNGQFVEMVKEQIQFYPQVLCIDRLDTVGRTNVYLTDGYGAFSVLSSSGSVNIVNWFVMSDIEAVVSALGGQIVWQK